MEDPPQEGEPFDYDAVPNRFYFDVESTGSLAPEVIVQEGIKVMQQKLAQIIQGLTEDDGGANAANGYAGPRSPDDNGGDAWNDQGFTTPYGNGGNQSSWGGQGGTTPYSSTPFGDPGQTGWS
jgi:DNA-directed RNA polymerase II subunit RPB3